MKVTFKQFKSFIDLPDDQVTEEALNEIFGSFFGGKVKPNNPMVAKMQDKKAGLKPDTAIMQKWQLAQTKNKSLSPTDKLAADRAKKKAMTPSDKKAKDFVMAANGIPVAEAFDNIKVHDLSHLGTPSYDSGEHGPYDETQTNENIKDGDVLHLGGNKTGVMMKAWPVEVTGNHSEESGFHKLKAGTTWDNFENGAYAASAEKARAIAAKFEN